MEKWKKIPGFEKYQISNLGRVARIKNGERKILKTSYKGSTHLCENGIKTHIYSGLLVLQLFGPEKPGPNYLPKHKDHNRANNRLDNLYWGRSGPYREITFNGKEYESVTHISESLGLRRKGIQERIRRGWNKEDAMSIPKGKIASSKPRAYKYKDKWYTVKQLSEMLNCHQDTVRDRIKRWQDMELVVNVPVGKSKKERNVRDEKEF